MHERSIPLKQKEKGFHPLKTTFSCEQLFNNLFHFYQIIYLIYSVLLFYRKHYIGI